MHFSEFTFQLHLCNLALGFAGQTGQTWPTPESRNIFSDADGDTEGKADAGLCCKYIPYLHTTAANNATRQSDRRFCVSLHAIHAQRICWRCTLVFLAFTEWFEESHAGGVDQQPWAACGLLSPTMRAGL